MFQTVCQYCDLYRFTYDRSKYRNHDILIMTSNKELLWLGQFISRITQNLMDKFEIFTKDGQKLDGLGRGVGKNSTFESAFR